MVTVIYFIIRYRSDEWAWLPCERTSIVRVRFILLYGTVVPYGTVRYGTVRYGTGTGLRYGTVRYGTGTLRYGTVRYCTVPVQYGEMDRIKSLGLGGEILCFIRPNFI